MITFRKEISRLNEESSTIRNADKKIMRVQDLQEFLSKFTEAYKDGRQ